MPLQGAGHALAGVVFPALAQLRRPAPRGRACPGQVPPPVTPVASQMHAPCSCVYQRPAGSALDLSPPSDRDCRRRRRCRCR